MSDSKKSKEKSEEDSNKEKEHEKSSKASSTPSQSSSNNKSEDANSKTTSKSRESSKREKKGQAPSKFSPECSDEEDEDKEKKSSRSLKKESLKKEKKEHRHQKSDSEDEESEDAKKKSRRKSTKKKKVSKAGSDSDDSNDGTSSDSSSGASEDDLEGWSSDDSSESALDSSEEERRDNEPLTRRMARKLSRNRSGTSHGKSKAGRKRITDKMLVSLARFLCEVKEQCLLGYWGKSMKRPDNLCRLYEMIFGLVEDNGTTSNWTEAAVFLKKHFNDYRSELRKGRGSVEKLVSVPGISTFRAATAILKRAYEKKTGAGQTGKKCSWCEANGERRFTGHIASECRKRKVAAGDSKPTGSTAGGHGAAGTR